MKIQNIELYIYNEKLNTDIMYDEYIIDCEKRFPCKRYPVEMFEIKKWIFF